MVLVSATVEDNGLDSGILGAGTEQCSHLGRSGLVEDLAAHVGLLRGGGGKGVPGHIVDHLGVDVAVAPEDHETWLLDGAAHVLAHPVVPASPSLVT